MINSKFLDQTILFIANNWYDNLTHIDECDHIKFECSKNKFRDRYLIKTGEFLKLTKKVETMCFKKIAFGLSENYEVDETLIDEYLNWCFDNYDFFIKEFKAFNLTNCANFSSEWTKDFLKFDFNSKFTLKDLDGIKISDSIFANFEKYGIPLCVTKLAEEKRLNEKQIKSIVLDKLETLTGNKNDLSKLKNMLRVTVENSPYTSEIIFNDIKKSFRKFFIYFNEEPWVPK